MENKVKSYSSGSREIKFRVRDPGTKSYIFNGMTIDEALRSKIAFLPQNVIYELSINKKDIHGNDIYIGDIISRRWKYKKRIDENRMIDKEFECKDMCAVLGDTITPPYCYDIEFVINGNIHQDYLLLRQKDE